MNPREGGRGHGPGLVEALHVAHVASEAAPFAQTGGLGDVLGSLPRALAEIGLSQTLVLPCYGVVDRGAHGLSDTGRAVTVAAGAGRHRFRILESAAIPGVRSLLLDCPELFGRPFLYGRGGRDEPDNDLRFFAFGRAALKALAAFGGRRPDLLHLHDWQTGLVAWELARKRGRHLPTLHTVHNLAMQGLFGAGALDRLGLDRGDFHPEGYEFWGKLSFLKAALVWADRLGTVSPTYAREIQGSACGMGLEGVLRGRAGDLVGVLNGIDMVRHDPAADPGIPARFALDDPAGKERCEADLRRGLGLLAPAPGKPRVLAAYVGRLTEQKGADLLPGALAPLLEADRVVLALLGSGDPDIEGGLRALERRYPERVHIRLDFDPALARRIYAGGDLLLMPSRFEPCGLAQMIAMRYGTLPVARRTGGLADTVRHGETGFVFERATAAALREAVVGAVEVMTTGGGPAMRRRAMAQDFSWDRSARRYAEIYTEVWRRALGVPP